MSRASLPEASLSGHVHGGEGRRGKASENCSFPVGVSLRREQWRVGGLHGKQADLVSGRGNLCPPPGRPIHYPLRQTSALSDQIVFLSTKEAGKQYINPMPSTGSIFSPFSAYLILASSSPSSTLSRSLFGDRVESRSEAPGKKSERNGKSIRAEWNR